jgi:hypothetical protein
MSPELKIFLIQKNLISPELRTPYNPYINRLYTRDDLYGGFDPAKYFSTGNTGQRQNRFMEF